MMDETSLDGDGGSMELSVGTAGVEKIANFVEHEEELVVHCMDALGLSNKVLSAKTPMSMPLPINNGAYDIVYMHDDR
jgi:hypothetical protein